MSTARIRFSADILRRLGEELNPHSDKGIVELVKDAYDANMTWCRIELIETDRAGGAIIVTDDGDGMTPAEIERGWLVLGRSSKAAARRTRLGRIPACSKGLGRLAALRMGSSALLTTRPRIQRADECRLRIDWSAFDAADLVDDVNLNPIPLLRCRACAWSGRASRAGDARQVALKPSARQNGRESAVCWVERPR